MMAVDLICKHAAPYAMIIYSSLVKNIYEQVYLNQLELGCVKFSHFSPKDSFNELDIIVYFVTCLEGYITRMRSNKDDIF